MLTVGTAQAIQASTTISLTVIFVFLFRTNQMQKLGIYVSKGLQRSTSLLVENSCNPPPFSLLKFIEHARSECLIIVLFFFRSIKSAVAELL